LQHANIALQTSGTIKWDYKINTVALDAYHGAWGQGRFVLELCVLFATIINIGMVSVYSCLLHDTHTRYYWLQGHSGQS